MRLPEPCLRIIGFPTLQGFFPVPSPWVYARTDKYSGGFRVERV